MTVPLDEYVQALDRAFATLLHHPHAITDHVIEIDGDRATIHAHIRTEHWVPEELAGADLPVPAALLPHGVRRSLRSSGRGGTDTAGGCRPRWNRRSV
ncbi:nuclear transport factor 2 family protein [Streptomyces albogriseolus]|uniref:nuclear transport factor 2 family protein n=1 Tax=Streptomyces albogriseolus TaxID=1887 RepID=UPI00345FCFF6